MGTRVGALEKGLDRLGVALRELQVKLVGQVQQETNQVGSCRVRDLNLLFEGGLFL